MNIIHITYAPLIESPPITKGSKAQRFWKYQKRIDRICKIKPESYQDSFAISDAVMETMQHCLNLGYSWEESNEGEPIWFNPQGKRVSCDN